MAGTETTETALSSFLDSLFGRSDAPAEALHGRGDAEAAWERWAAGEPARSSAEHWLYIQFDRGPEKERGADLGLAQSKAGRVAEMDREAGS
jgi:hypothetical protein